MNQNKKMGESMYQRLNVVQIEKQKQLDEKLLKHDFSCKERYTQAYASAKRMAENYASVENALVVLSNMMLMYVTSAMADWDEPWDLVRPMKRWIPSGRRRCSTMFTPMMSQKNHTRASISFVHHAAAHKPASELLYAASGAH